MGISILSLDYICETISSYDSYEIKDGCFFVYDRGHTKIIPLANVLEIDIGSGINESWRR